MAKTKTERIADIQEQIEQLKNQEKRLMQEQKEQERKDRTKRLCKRAGLLESLLPETITLTDEQFKSFLEKTLISEYSRKILNGLTAQGNPPPAAKSTYTAQENDEDEGNDTRQSG